MCGVTGFLERRLDQPPDVLQHVVGAMTESLRHRGPDDSGVWVDAAAGIALGHRRLAVIDLSDAGKQPMVSSGGRYVLTYNGEIYNSAELHRRLSAAGCRFRGHSDTELLVEAIEQWGLDAALQSANGMFAFGLWDRRERKLHLVRDRLGEKPMYYGWFGQTFVFGSELKAVRRHPEFRSEVDRGALALYFRHNCIPAPHCIYSALSKLLPGTILTVDADTPPFGAVPRPYWSAREAAEAGVRAPFDGSPQELTDELERLLLDAVGLRMYADVPLGAFLSGGIDSSTIVALMQAQSSRKVKTFTVGLDDTGYDESADAAAVAAHLGTDHVALRLTPADAMDTVPRLPELYDEPFSDSSQIPTFCVSQLARRHVTVSLSGDGGDELFGGYNRYAWAPPIWERIRRLPTGARNALASALRIPPPRVWDSFFERAAPVLPARFRVRYPGIKVEKIAGLLPSTGLDDMYRRLSSHTHDPAAMVVGARESRSQLSDSGTWPDLADPVNRMMYLDQVTYLPDDILVKVDRASMGVSLEARVPMLDHRVVEFAWRTPVDMKVRDGEGKWLLRQVLYRHVPRQLVNRPKAGFGVPIGDWLCGPLREWAEGLLAGGRIREEGFLDPGIVRTLWDEHISGRRNRADQLWDVLMFQSWLEASSRAPAAVASG